MVVDYAPASIAVSDQPLRRRVLAERQRARIMAVRPNNALQNACAPLVVREPCGSDEHVVQLQSFGDMFHLNILAQEARPEQCEREERRSPPPTLLLTLRRAREKRERTARSELRRACVAE